MSDVDRLVHEWSVKHGRRYRLVILNANYEVERCDRGTPGLEQWTTVLKVGGLRDGGLSRHMCEAIDGLAEKLAELQKSLTYSQGGRLG